VKWFAFELMSNSNGSQIIIEYQVDIRVKRTRWARKDMAVNIRSSHCTGVETCGKSNVHGEKGKARQRGWWS